MNIRIIILRTRYKIKKYIIEWLFDKKNWLLSFNKRPTVIINQDIIVYDGGYHAIKINGRVDVTINGDIKIIDKTSDMDDYFSIEEAVISAYIAGYEDAKCNHISDSEQYFNQKYKRII